jgi:hypothetical protein
MLVDLDQSIDQPDDRRWFISPANLGWTNLVKPAGKIKKTSEYMHYIHRMPFRSADRRAHGSMRPDGVLPAYLSLPIDFSTHDN